jgi:hypothetical protein
MRQTLFQQGVSGLCTKRTRIDKERSLQKPLQFGTQWTDTTTYNAVDTQGMQNNIAQSTFDGWGTLQTPNETYSVLRLKKVVKELYDSLGAIKMKRLLVRLGGHEWDIDYIRNISISFYSPLEKEPVCFVVGLIDIRFPDKLYANSDFTVYLKADTLIHESKIQGDKDIKFAGNNNDLIHCYPNPMQNSVVVEISPLLNFSKLGIYNVSGKTVYRANNVNNIRKNVINWNGKNNEGQKVAPGQYFVKTDTKRYSKTIGIVKLN